MAKWYVAAKKADFNGIGQRFSISPVLARVIRNRDIEGDEAIEKYLHGTIRDLYDPAFLKGSREAVLLLKDKIKGQMPIRVIGDYDADGICSSYILKRGLEACGAVVDTMIPHRMKDGYGLNEHLVDEAYADGIDTILTCDNGIAAYAQIEQAKKYGMTVIITDHHEIPYEEEPLAEPDPETGETSRRRYKIPPADVVIDPKQPGDTYPFQEICGAVVAFKLMQLLFAEFGFDGISTDLTSGNAGICGVCNDLRRYAVAGGKPDFGAARAGADETDAECWIACADGGQPDFTLAGWKAGGISYRLCARSVPERLRASGQRAARDGAFGQQNKRSCGSAGSIFEAVKRQPERNDRGICQDSGRDDRIRPLKGRPCSGCFPAGLP